MQTKKAHLKSNIDPYGEASQMPTHVKQISTSRCHEIGVYHSWPIMRHDTDTTEYSRKMTRNNIFDFTVGSDMAKHLQVIALSRDKNADIMFHTTFLKV